MQIRWLWSMHLETLWRFPWSFVSLRMCALNITLRRQYRDWRVKAETPWFVIDLFQGKMRWRPRQGPRIRYFNQGWKIVRWSLLLELGCQEGEGARYEHDHGEVSTRRGEESGSEEYLPKLQRNGPRCHGRWRVAPLVRVSYYRQCWVSSSCYWIWVISVGDVKGNSILVVISSWSFRTGVIGTVVLWSSETSSLPE